MPEIEPATLLFIRECLGGFSVALTVVAYIPYFQSIFRRRTKPHLFSWLIWTIMNMTAFIAQYMKGGGAGSWATGFTAIMSFIVIVFAISRGEKDITRSDWIAFIGAFLAILLWYVTNDPLWSVVLVSIIDVVACYPTLRKSYMKPWEELALSYAICGVRAVIAIAALENFSLVTVLYPIAMVLSNGILTFVLLLRRSAIRKSSQVMKNVPH